VEIDLFWTSTVFEDLFGYAFKRATSAAALPNTQATQLLRDPLADAYFDVDPELTPNVTYYYTVHRLDTIDFPDPSRQTIGPASNVASANPLNPITALNPAFGSSVGASPSFQWSPVDGAAGYQVYVWDRFPSLQEDPSLPAEPGGNAVPPVWPANLNSPGSSFVTAPATSVTYQGPALQAGRTYYWMVVAVDSANPQNITALSASRIMKFTR
jgi:hypothetical protein